MGRRFAISDLHGCFETFKALLHEICKFDRDDSLYLLGDLIDRGPNSRKLMDYIIDMINDGLDVHYVRGNHEQMLLDALHSDRDFVTWTINGAKHTLNNFNVDRPRDIPKKYISFVQSSEFYIELNDYVLVHAGLNCEAPNPFSDRDSMMWTRHNHVDLIKTKGKPIVTGHTPHIYDEIVASLRTNKIKIDGGCVYRDKSRGMGLLVALELNEKKLFSAPNIEDY